MPTGSRQRPDAAEEPTTTDEPAITACETTPGRVVFLEAGNTDAWIATDGAVELRR